MPYTILKADIKNNKRDIISLWKRNFPDLPEERYKWIYEDNPAGRASCWLLKETEQNKIVGATALFPRRVFVHGKQMIAGIAGDFVIDREHRTLGPALLLLKAILSISNGKETPFNFLYGFPNKISEPVLLKAGYKILGEIHSLTKPLRSHYYLKKHANIPFITRGLSFFVDFGLKIFSKKNFRNNDFEVDILTSFDHRFDIFWASVSNQFAMIGERTSSYLNWRFIKSPHKNYHAFAQIQKKDRAISGYIVYNITDNKAYIADLLFLNLNEVFDSLLLEFLLYQRSRGIDAVSINFMGSHALMEELRKYGFSIRESGNKVVIYPMSNSYINTNIFDKRNWYLTSGDNDI